MSTTPITGTGSVLLKFEPHSTPDPARAGEKLMLRFVVNKPRETTQVFCDQITFQFDVDASSCTEPTYLATAPDEMQQSVSPPDWDIIEPHDPGVFMFISKGTGEVRKSYTFDIFGIDVSTLVGTATVTVTEHSTDHDVAHCPTGDHDDCFEDRVQSFDVPKFPPGFTSVDFKPNKTKVPPGGEVTLCWVVEKVASYQLLQDDDPIDPVRFTHSTVGDVTTWSYTARGLQEDSVFTLRVGYEMSHTKVRREYYVPIDVQRPRLDLYVQGSATIRQHEQATLSWNIAHVTNCVLSSRVGNNATRRLATIDHLDSYDVTPTETTTYSITGTTETGQTFSSSQLEIDVLPAAPPLSSDLWFIKTANTATGKVELHIAKGVDGLQQSTPWTSAFDIGDGPNGTWLFDPEVSGVVFVKTRNTDSGHLEVRWEKMDGTRGSYQETDFTAATPADGTWVNGGSYYGRPYLWFLKTARTDSGRVQVWHKDGYHVGYEYWQRWDTPFEVRAPSDGVWLLGPREKHSHPLVAFVQTSGTPSGMVEISYARGGNISDYVGVEGPFKTGFEYADAADGRWQLASISGPQEPDLALIRIANTQSGRIEVHYASPADNYQIVSGGFTAFEVADGPNGTWQL